MKTWFKCFLEVVSILVVAAAVCAAADDMKTHASCNYCGMNRETFGHSRMLIEYDDFIPRARQLLSAHRPGRTAADNHYLGHGPTFDVPSASED